MNHDGTDPWTEEERGKVEVGFHVEAIKAYRARTGTSLYEAKKSWERLKMDMAGEKTCPHCNGTGKVAK